MLFRSKNTLEALDRAAGRIETRSGTAALAAAAASRASSIDREDEDSLIEYYSFSSRQFMGPANPKRFRGAALKGIPPAASPPPPPPSETEIPAPTLPEPATKKLTRATAPKGKEVVRTHQFLPDDPEPRRRRGITARRAEPAVPSPAAHSIIGAPPPPPPPGKKAYSQEVAEVAMEYYLWQAQSLNKYLPVATQKDGKENESEVQRREETAASQSPLQREIQQHQDEENESFTTFTSGTLSHSNSPPPPPPPPPFTFKFPFPFPSLKLNDFS